MSTDGSDANPGTESQPWKSLSYAGQKITAGDTLYIRGGVYQEHFYIYNSGSETSPIIVTNYNNEEVIIDGMDMTLPPHKSGTPLIGVKGDWVIVSNLTLSNSGEYGVDVEGSHDVLDNLYIHHSWATGVIMTGNYSLAQNMRIWSNDMDNEGGTLSVSWGSGISCARYPDYCTIRNTVAWENWGEGISTFEALHTTIEDNTSYNNMQNYYVSDTKYTVFQRNLSYYTPGTEMDFNTTCGILVDDEKGVPIPLGPDGARYPSSDNTIINNLVIGGNHGLETSTAVNTNNLYAYNTFGNSDGDTGEPVNILINPGTCTNCKFINNIVEQDDARTIISVEGTGFSFSNNLWSKAPPSVAAGDGDVISDPQLAKAGALDPGQLTAAYFKLLPSSPAIDKGTTSSIIDTDYFLTSRGSSPDIGAHEEGEILTPTVLPTNTPVPPTATPTIVIPTYTPTPVPANTSLPTSTSTKSPSNTPAASATPVRTSTPTNIPTSTTVPGATPTATALIPTYTPTPVPTNTSLPTSMSTKSPSNTPAASVTPVRTSIPTSLLTKTPNLSKTPTKTLLPTSKVTNTPRITSTPTGASTSTAQPTLKPSSTPKSGIRPDIRIVTPNQGLTKGKLLVSISGANFQPGAVVMFGLLTCSSMQVVTDTEITCVAPPSSAKTVDVTVINPDGQQGVLLQGFQYTKNNAVQVFLPLIR